MAGSTVRASPHRPRLRTAAAPLCVVLAIGASACGGSWHATPAAELEGNGITNSGGATVITAEELHTASGSVLRALMGKVPNMKVEFIGTDRCPAIALRRAKDFHGFNFPDVYLDGTRATNTCILDNLPAAELDRVEIYPQGFTVRPGYGTSTHGLILLFSRTA